jgi:hypothetical protein
MYSLDEINEALEKDKLSDALYKMERFAREHGLTDLATWCSWELNGYPSGHGQEDIKHRTVGMQWRDIYGRPMVIPPEFSFIQRVPVWIGVSELEGYVEEGFGYSLPELSKQLSQFSNVPVGSGGVAPDVVRGLLDRIRLQARSRLHDNIPRIPNRKLIYPAPNFASLGADAELARILSRRWTEANLSFESGAYLATMILLGSILEGVLLSKIEQNPAQSNSASSSPKDRSGRPRPFSEWKLQNLIEVAHECGWLKKPYKDFSHVVRDYRNFIHPNKERQEGITFDVNTCKVVWEVVSAALC